MMKFKMNGHSLMSHSELYQQTVCHPLFTFSEQSELANENQTLSWNISFVFRVPTYRNPELDYSLGIRLKWCIAWSGVYVSAHFYLNKYSHRRLWSWVVYWCEAPFPFPSGYFSAQNLPNHFLSQTVFAVTRETKWVLLIFLLTVPPPPPSTPTDEKIRVLILLPWGETVMGQFWMGGNGEKWSENLHKGTIKFS